MKIRMHFLQYIVTTIVIFAIFIPFFFLSIFLSNQITLLIRALFIAICAICIIGFVSLTIFYVQYYVVISNDTITMNKPFKKTIIVRRNQIIKISIIIDRTSYYATHESFIKVDKIRYFIISYKSGDLIKYIKLSRELLRITNVEKALKNNNYKIEGIY